jgi:transcriptional regulator with XRE-family HTH domain
MIRPEKNPNGAGRPLKPRTSHLCQMLTAVRLEAGMTQAEVATRMRTTPNVVARWENGQKHPSLTTLEKFAEVTGNQLEIRFVRL